MVEMQKHIEALQKENEHLKAISEDNNKIIMIRLNTIRSKNIELAKKSKQFRIMIGSFVIVLTFLGVWIYALYYANSLLATDNQTKENWKRSAVELDGKYNDLQDDMKAQKKAFEELSKTCTTAQIKKAVKNTPPPPMVKDMK